MDDTDLIRNAIATLTGLGAGISAKARKPRPAANVLRPDALLTLTHRKTVREYAVAYRRGIGRSTVGTTRTHLENLEGVTGLPGLLVADHVPGPVADELRKLRRPFVDAAGNCFLDMPGLLVYVSGRKPSFTMPAARSGRTFGVASLKVMFALLCDPTLGAAPQRGIAAAAGVSLGSIPKTLAELQRDGHLLVTRSSRRLHGSKRLLDAWSMGYAQQLRPKTLKAVYAAPNFAKWKHWSLDVAAVRWGGEPAANLLAGYLQPGVLTLYGSRLPPRLVVEQRLGTAAQPNAMHTLEWRTPFWGAALPHGGRADCVSPVLVYADLLATGEARCIEMADRLYGDHLARLLPAG